MPLPQKITATLLYERFQPVDATELMAEVSAIMAPAGLGGFTPKATEGPWDASFETDGFAVNLAFATKPEPSEKFSQAVASPYAELTKDDWRSVVRHHRQAIVVEIAYATPANRDVFELMLSLGQITVNHLIVHSRPEAIHWGQSDQFFDADDFLMMADVLFPLPIFLHPKPFSSGRMAEGTQALGFHLEGAEQILGKHVIFNEAPARIHYLLERVFAFVEHCRENQMILGDGAAFGMMVGETILVNHQAPSHDCPHGAIVLTLRERDGVFQLQPDGAAPLRGERVFAEAQAQTAAAMNVAPNQAPATQGRARPASGGIGLGQGSEIDAFFSSPDAAAASRVAAHGLPNQVSVDGAARLREASKERLFEEQLASNRRVANMQMLGSMAAGGGYMGRITPEAQPYIVWFAIVVTLFLHPPAAVVLGLLQFFLKPPYYVMLSGVFLVFMGATISGADPALGYFDVLGLTTVAGFAGDGAETWGSLMLQMQGF